MLAKIIKQVFIYIFLPQGLFFYSFYFNDFLNLDIFNMKKIANLNMEMIEIKDFIKSQNEISNNKLENIQNVPSNSNNIGVFIITVIVILGVCYLGFNYFNNNSGEAGIISEQIIEQQQQNKILSKIGKRDLIPIPDTYPGLTHSKILENIKALDLKELSNIQIEILSKCDRNSLIMKEFFQIKK
jgi:hypothetical protein